MNKITRQSTTDDEYLYLLGMAQWVFNSNCNFIVEMIDKEHHNNSSEKHLDLYFNISKEELDDYKSNYDRQLEETIKILDKE